jgi:predicted NAD/FAD-dependent oxidoreductase
VAALNTPTGQASAAVFLRVLRDALFSGTGSADLLLPRRDLGALFPVPALAWLRSRGVTIRLSARVRSLAPLRAGWSVDGQSFDAVVLAAPALEAARLAQAIRPDWSAKAYGLRYEPIVTVYVDAGPTRLPQPMMVLRCGPDAPAQFVFDRGQLGGPSGLLAFVISGAQAWVDAGREATLQATLDQARSALGPLLRGDLQPRQLITEKRATFRCVPALQRPASTIAPMLVAAGDYVDGPYPATIEGAVRSAVEAVAALN